MVSEDEVAKIAKLARLELAQDFIPVVTGHLNSILEYVAQLDRIDTTGVAAMSHVHRSNDASHSASINVFREDVVHTTAEIRPAEPLGDPTILQQPMLPEQALLSNVPDHSGRFIRVPLIVE